MLLPETKEREYRFRLALRIGLPIFALVLALVSNSLITSYQSLDTSFYIISILLIVFSVYFILYIIYNSFDIRITEPITKTFTREYLYKYLRKQIKKSDDYTLIMISIDNLSDINTRYGIENGDKVLREVTVWITNYFKSKDLQNFYMGQIKGGDFVIGLKGSKNRYSTLLELMCLKSDELIVENIEIKITTAITDTSFSKELEYLVENLFEIGEVNRNKKLLNQESQKMDPNELELLVINAIKNRSFVVTAQEVFQNDKEVIKECFVKLKASTSKIIYPKSYMKILDKLGLMVDFDLMVLQNNIINCSDNLNEKYAMNISPSSIRNPKFLSRAKELIRENPLSKNRLIFLLSEYQYYSHVGKYNATLKSLRDIGVLITIERVGAIHTSYLYLRDLDIDMIRFDSTYTKDIQNKKSKIVIEGFNAMAHAKGVKTWMKMIETKESKELAQGFGIDYLQGKYLSPVEIKYEN